jgi:hypothetical protein
MDPRLHKIPVLQNATALTNQFAFNTDQMDFRYGLSMYCIRRHLPMRKSGRHNLSLVPRLATPCACGASAHRKADRNDWGNLILAISPRLVDAKNTRAVIRFVGTCNCD